MSTKDYSPNVVASSFIKQYYEMMTKSPENLHKFYNENSYFLHSDLAHPSGVSATGPDAIRSAMSALNLRYTKVDLTNGYVDAQKSANNGVFVLVVGTLAPPDAPDKPFVQTFLLSNQGSSAYYVSNSVFRLLVPGGDAADAVLVQLNPTPAVVETAPAPAPAPVVVTPTVAEEPSPAATAAQATAAASDASASHIEAVEALLQETVLEPQAHAPAAPAPAAAAVETAPAPAPAAPAVDPNRKLNYSDIVRKQHSGADASTPPPAPVKAAHHAPAPAAAAPKPKAAAPAEAASHSIYIKNLPEVATNAEISALFAPFGTVQNVDQAVGRSFAFVKFDTHAAVQAAVAAGAGGKLTLHGQALRVEERNSTRAAGSSSSGAAAGSVAGSGNNTGRRERDGRGGGREGREGGDRERRGGDRERGDRGGDREGRRSSGSDGRGASGAGRSASKAGATKAN